MLENHRTFLGDVLVEHDAVWAALQQARQSITPSEQRLFAEVRPVVFKEIECVQERRSRSFGTAQFVEVGQAVAADDNGLTAMVKLLALMRAAPAAIVGSLSVQS
jgi:hypothetical protein